MPVHSHLRRVELSGQVILEVALSGTFYHGNRITGDRPIAVELEEGVVSGCLINAAFLSPSDDLPELLRAILFAIAAHPLHRCAVAAEATQGAFEQLLESDAIAARGAARIVATTDEALEFLVAQLGGSS